MLKLLLTIKYLMPCQREGVLHGAYSLPWSGQTPASYPMPVYCIKYKVEVTGKQYPVCLSYVNFVSEVTVEKWKDGIAA